MAQLAQLAKEGGEKLLAGLERAQDRPGYISVRQAARRAKVPDRTLYHWIEAGTWGVRVVKLHNRRLLVDEADLERWITSLQLDHE
jgi:excisionase family DNA binding protein